MPLDLSQFDLPQMLRCGLGVRRAAAGSDSMEEALHSICRYLYDDLRTPSGERACALVRAYKTHPYASLEPSLQDFALRLLDGATPAATLRCLTLMASVGDQLEWNDRRKSAGHQAIPLPRPDFVEKAPMIAQLFHQFGLDLTDVVAPSENVVRDLEGRTYGVFFVENATDSPFIPAKDFVRSHRIRSVLGCGGSLRGGDLFAIILFTRLEVAPDAADRFRTIALDIKSALFSYDEESVFSAAAV